jgi:hypothetical protein
MVSWTTRASQRASRARPPCINEKGWQSLSPGDPKSSKWPYINLPDADQLKNIGLVAGQSAFDFYLILARRCQYLGAYFDREELIDLQVPFSV